MEPMAQASFGLLRDMVYTGPIFYAYLSCFLTLTLTHIICIFVQSFLPINSNFISLYSTHIFPVLLGAGRSG